MPGPFEPVVVFADIHRTIFTDVDSLDARRFRVAFERLATEEVFRYYRAADACFISSLHDGMNLVAKEFVAARDDGRCVLVLSRFAGASRELTEALIVNPYDVDGTADALFTALTMPPAEIEDRMRAMRQVVSVNNIFQWANSILKDAALCRERESLRQRIEAERQFASVG